MAREPVDRDLLDEQLAYYRARAPEYDEWFLRTGRYDRGVQATRDWFAEVAEVERALDRFAPRGQVLELAAGTGWWTAQLARYAGALTAVDASPETIERNRVRMKAMNLALPTYVQADLFAWQPVVAYDAVFFGFWLSHVPEEHFAAFWQLVRNALAPGGRVFFVDSRRDPQSTAHDHVLDDGDVQWRRLNDGRRFRVVKRFYDPLELEETLRRLGWQAVVRTTARYFLIGEAS